MNKITADDIKQAQTEALGTDCISQIYSPAIASMFPKPVKKYLIKNDDETFNEYESTTMTLKASEKCLGLMIIGDVSPDIVKLDEIKNLLEKFYCISIRILPPLSLEKKGNKGSIEMKHPMKMRKKSINVLSIINLLNSYTPADVYSTISIINHAIYDPADPDDIIAGRACGRDGCVIGQDEDIRQFYSTIIHECGHIFGLDHCSAWKCLMNGGMSTFIQLCPMDLRKLQYMIGFDVEERYKGLLECFESLDEKLWKKEKAWTKKIIKLLEKESMDRSVEEGESVIKKVKNT